MYDADRKQTPTADCQPIEHAVIDAAFVDEVDAPPPSNVLRVSDVRRATDRFEPERIGRDRRRRMAHVAAYFAGDLIGDRTQHDLERVPTRPEHATRT